MIISRSKRKMSPNKRQPGWLKKRLSPLYVGFLLLLSSANVAVAVYSEPIESPTCTPGTCMYGIPEVLNGSNANQQKSGALLLGPLDSATCTTLDRSGCAQLCLNPTKQTTADAPEISDAANCVTSWGTLINSIAVTSGFVHAVKAGAPLPADIGQGSLQGSLGTDANGVSLSTGQLISFIATANGSAASAVFANGLTSSNYAAIFGGTLAIAPQTVGTVSIPGQLCLGGTASADCITSFSSIATNVDPNIVRLQDLKISQSISYDDGRTATSGMLTANSLVAGAPTGTTNPTASCGDGICTLVNESHLLCPVDCQ
jgi:hypothetical protein